MTTYADLSPYTYTGTHPDAVNVGWLGRELEFEQGDVPNGLWTSLLRLADHPQKVFRGFHHCEFCDVESPVRFDAPDAERGFVTTGHTELHVAGASGRVLIAPSLVLHYIDAHRYRPPQEFIDAVLQLTEGWPADHQ